MKSKRSGSLTPYWIWAILLETANTIWKTQYWSFVMATFTIDELVKAAEQLPQTDLEALTTQVLALKAKRATPNLPQNEALLLQKINRGLPDDLQKRYQELISVRQAEVLTESEHTELLQLTNQVEQYQVDRLKCLTELAGIRKVSLMELLDNLGIQSGTYKR